MSNNPFLTNPALEKLSEDARKSVLQAFEAMELWRNQLNDIGAKNSEAVFDKLTDAAKSLGWPTDYLNMSRQHVQQAAKLQVQIVDQIMDAWQRNVAAFGKSGQPPVFPTFPQMPGMPGSGQPSASGNTSIPGLGDLAANPMMPLQLWMQAAEAWQKSWQQAMAGWTEAPPAPTGKSSGSNKSGSPR